MDKILEHHEDMIDNHEDRLDKIQTDLTDIKTRLGIKDFTNGQVAQYQEKLVQNQIMELNERKENDAYLRGEIEKLDNRLSDDFKKLDERLWYIVTGILIVVAFDILALFMGGML